MIEAQWARVKAVFLDAVSLPEAERNAFLCDLDREEREISGQVRDLLAQEASAGPDLLHPCWVEEGGEEEVRRFAVGATLASRFEVLGFLGAGGLGEVYRAYDRQQDVLVALKTPRGGLSSDRSALRMLRRELNAARSVTHPNVCRLHDVHWDADGLTPPFFTMELLEGETLARYLNRKGRLTMEEAKPLLDQMLNALEAAHRSGIAHRDFKPGNVMLTEFGTRVVVMDFGMARAVQGQQIKDRDSGANVSVTRFAGTPAYMAPEQLRGEEASYPADIHAFGLVMFEMMTGQKPFSGGCAVEAASRRLHEEAPSPSSLVSGLDRAWEYTMLRCLKREASARPAGAPEVRACLEQPPPIFWNRRKMLLFGLVPAGGMAAAIAAAWNPGWGGEAARPVVEIADLANNSGDKGLDYLCDGTTGEVWRLLDKVPEIRAVRLYGPASKSVGDPTRRFLLEGQLTAAEGGPRWNVRIVQRVGGETLWQESFPSQPSGQVASAALVIAQKAGHRLQEHLTRQGVRSGTNLAGAAVDASPAGNGMAFDHYMRARYLLEQASPTSAHAAIGYLERAVDEDPRFALAWSALADAHLILTSYEPGKAENLLEVARNFAERSIQIDANLAEGHAALAAVRQQLLDWNGAESSYREALRIKPVFARAHRWYAGFLLQFGRFAETLEHAQLALDQDPYDQMGPLGVGVCFIFCGKLREAIALMEPAVEGKDLEGTRHNLALAYLRMAQTTAGARREDWFRRASLEAERISLIEKRKAGHRPRLSDRLSTLIHCAAGDRLRAEPFFAKLREDYDLGRLTAADMAIFHAVDRDYERALDLLELCYRRSPYSLLYIKVNPFLSDLRGLPRFQKLVGDLKL